MGILDNFKTNKILEDNNRIITNENKRLVKENKKLYKTVQNFKRFLGKNTNLKIDECTPQALNEALKSRNVLIEHLNFEKKDFKGLSKDDLKLRLDNYFKLHEDDFLGVLTTEFIGKNINKRNNECWKRKVRLLNQNIETHIQEKKELKTKIVELKEDKYCLKKDLEYNKRKNTDAYYYNKWSESEFNFQEYKNKTECEIKKLKSDKNISRSLSDDENIIKNLLLEYRKLAIKLKEELGIVRNNYKLLEKTLNKKLKTNQELESLVEYQKNVIAEQHKKIVDYMMKNGEI